jgi:hypothetical protein
MIRRGSIVTAEPQGDEEQRRKVMNWLFLLLRYAITRAENDRAAVCATAAELDSPATPCQTGHGFFLKTSRAVCLAILEQDDPRSFAVLKQHSERIDDPRLKRCFCAAIGLAELSRVADNRARERSKHSSLWRGLRKSCAEAVGK